MENQDFVINFQRKHEPPKHDRMLERVGEIKSSWISGPKGDDVSLIVGPVDMNMDNMLVTNMLSLTKDEYRVLLQEMLIGYTVEVTSDLSVEFFTPFMMREKNILLVSEVQETLKTNEIVAAVVNAGPTQADKIWDALSASHLKGMRALYFSEGAIEYTSGSQLQRMYNLVDIRKDQSGIQKTSGLILK